MTKQIRWEIQALGVRLAKAASAEELSRRNRTKAKSRAAHEVEIRQIVLDIRKLISRIDHDIPSINLAITTSGASLSTTTPASVSPSRILQASYFLNAGDALYSMNPDAPAQVGPTFTLSLYMLFAGHAYRAHNDLESMRDTTWKEVIHKARVKLIRVPIHFIYCDVKELSASSKPSGGPLSTPIVRSIEDAAIPGRGSISEFAYQLSIVEDLNDDRMHSFEDDEPQPGPYEDVALAGIREILPIHQISKIFYADTGKILNIGSEGETNSPVLLLKRDINAPPPRKKMENSESNYEDEDPDNVEIPEREPDGSQNDVDEQLHRESSVLHMDNNADSDSLEGVWRFPPDLDPEWLALEVYTETEESSSDDERDVNDDSAYASHRPSSSGEDRNQDGLAADLADLTIDPKSSPPSSKSHNQISTSNPLYAPSYPTASNFGAIRSSLSLLEMLIRLTSLQQFQQAPHLTVHDEILTFFLEESSTTGGDGDERRRHRREARMKVGFDPYDESPVKRRGEEYQYQNQNQDGYREYSRGGTPYEDYDQRSGYAYGRSSPRFSRERSMTPQGSPSPRGALEIPPSSPIPPYQALPRKGSRPLDRVRHERGDLKAGSLLGRGMSVETDSTLGTSPGSPTLVDRKDRAEEA